MRPGPNLAVQVLQALHLASSTAALTFFQLQKELDCSEGKKVGQLT